MGVRWVLLAATTVVAGCGGPSGPSRVEAVARAGTICQTAAIPGIPLGGRGGANRAVRMAGLTRAQESREVDRLRAIGWKDEAFEQALDGFEGAFVHLDLFVREGRAGRLDRAERARAAYDRAITEWQMRTASLGLDVCSRYGFAF